MLDIYLGLPVGNNSGLEDEISLVPRLDLPAQLGEVAGLLQGLLRRPPGALQVGGSGGTSRSFRSRIRGHRVVSRGVRVERSICIGIFLSVSCVCVGF